MGQHAYKEAAERHHAVDRHGEQAHDTTAHGGFCVELDDRDIKGRLGHGAEAGYDSEGEGDVEAGDMREADNADAADARQDGGWVKMPMRAAPTKNRMIETGLSEDTLHCIKEYPVARLIRPHMTLRVGEDNPFPLGLAKGVGLMCADVRKHSGCFSVDQPVGIGKSGVEGGGSVVVIGGKGGFFI